MSKKGDMLALEDIEDTLGYPLLGVIPEDTNIIVSTNKGEPLVTLKNTQAKMGYEKAAMNYMQGKTMKDESDFKYLKTSLFKNLFKFGN